MVIAVAAGTIAVHHLLFAYLQTQHSAVFLVPAQDATFSNVMIHADVVVESAVLIVITLNSYKEAMVGCPVFQRPPKSWLQTLPILI